MRSCVLLVLLSMSLALSTSAAQVKETKSALESDPKGWTNLLADADLKDWKRVAIPPGSKLKEPSPWKYDATRKILVCNGIGYHEMLLYNKDIADGIFHVEWRFAPVEGKKGYNSGVYVRNSANGAIWHQAQVGANVGYFFGVTLIDGKPGRMPQVREKGVPNRAKPIGDWNTYEITCKGKNVTLWVNGAVTADWKDCQVPSGYFGMEAEGYLIEFKDIQYKGI